MRLFVSCSFLVKILSGSIVLFLTRWSFLACVGAETQNVYRAAPPLVVIKQNLVPCKNRAEPFRALVRSIQR